jgi:anti-sigma regulatory factor (Ser/Thr protein kinase)
MRLQLFPTVQAPRQARREVSALAARIDEDSLSSVSTVISELVTISVAHGASKLIEISLALDDGKLEGSLCDDGAGTRALARARALRDNSLVLRIVDSLVEEWGTSTGANRVWFRMAVRPI